MRYLLISLVIASACSRGEWVRDYYGHLPGTNFHVPEPGGRHSMLVTDKRTGLPIPYAGLTIYAEDIEPEALPGRLLMELEADEFGIVSVLWDPELAGAHWVFDKSGFAPVQDFSLGDDWISLHPGREIRGRLLDPQGRPAAGIEVEYYLGCPHSPAVRRATTDDQGWFLLKDVGPELWGEFWAPAPGAEVMCASPGRLPVPGYVLEPIRPQPGIRVEGTLYDAQGKPVPDCPVRSLNYPRGPKTRTDDSGHFVIDSCEVDPDIQFEPPAVRLDMMSTEPVTVPPEQPERRRLVRVHVPGDEGRYAVWFDESEVFEPELTDFFEVFTHHEGRLVLSFEHEDFGFGQIEVDVSGPETDIPSEAFPVPGFLAVMDAGGRPSPKVAIDLWHDGRWRPGFESPGGGWLYQAGAQIRLRLEDETHAWNYRTLKGESPFVVRLGGSTLELKVIGTDWPCCVVDGQAMWMDEEERIILHGLDAGPHTVLVGARGCIGKVARVVLDPNEHRVLELTLEPRPGSASR